MTRTMEIGVTVNGRWCRAVVRVRTSLADWLREDLQLTGTHLGCEHGVCGSCTVLVDRRTVRSCLMLAVQADGREVATVEGLALGEELNSLQAAFSEHHALQCGFCTPGFLMSVTEYLEEGRMADPDAIRRRLAGNLCRCTGYQNIVAAVHAAAERNWP